MVAEAMPTNAAARRRLAVAGGLEPPTTGLTTPRLSRDIWGYLLSFVIYLGPDFSAPVRMRAR